MYNYCKKLYTQGEYLLYRDTRVLRYDERVAAKQHSACCIVEIQKTSNQNQSYSTLAFSLAKAKLTISVSAEQHENADYQHLLSCV